jgi:hypothetical protein
MSNQMEGKIDLTKVHKNAKKRRDALVGGSAINNKAAF